MGPGTWNKKPDHRLKEQDHWRKEQDHRDKEQDYWCKELDHRQRKEPDHQAQGAGPPELVSPLAPTTIPKLDGAEPYFGPQHESIIELDEAGTYFESELDREEFYEAVRVLDAFHSQNV